MKLFNFIFWSFLTLNLPEGYGKPNESSCTFTREYITSLEYMRSHKNFEISEAEARKTALQVSQGCTGAAARFVKVTAALSQLGISTPNAIQNGVEFSARTDSEADTFVFIFLRAFLEDYLDLDLMSALKLARELTLEIQSNVAGIARDFEKLTQFCIGTKDLNLPRPQCAYFASRLVHKSEKFEGEIAESFFKTFTFLKSEKGAALTTGQALELAEKLIEGGRNSADNFIQAFKYGSSSTGLNLDHEKAIQFAYQMAVPEVTPQKLLPLPEKSGN